MNSSVVKYAVFGAVNTVITYGVYFALVFFVDPRIAYSASYVLGIGLAYVFNQKFVFRGKQQAGHFFYYPLIYLVLFATGYLTLEICLVFFKIDKSVAALFSTFANIPLGYLLNRLLFRQKQER